MKNDPGQTLIGGGGVDFAVFSGGEGLGGPLGPVRTQTGLQSDARRVRTQDRGHRWLGPSPVDGFPLRLAS
jgi:hypothetical protein